MFGAEEKNAEFESQFQDSAAEEVIQSLGTLLLSVSQKASQPYSLLLVLDYTRCISFAISAYVSLFLYHFHLQP